MLRIIIFAAVIASLLVFLRLVLLSVRSGSRPRPPVREDKVIDAVEPALEIRSYRFHGCDAATGPADPLDFHERLYLSVGPRDSSRTRTYCLHVITPRALERELAAGGARFGRDCLIVRRFEPDTILHAVRQRIHELNELGESLD